MSDDPSFQLPEPSAPSSYPEVEARPELVSVKRCRFEIPMRYSADAYVGWLTTDSLVNTLDDESKRGFLDDIRRLIDSKYDGRVERNFVYEVMAAASAS
jgi:hypothetical protein